MNGSISFPSSSISSSAINGLDDKINQATSNAYNTEKMREDLLEVSNGKTGLFTWSENGETITGLNANYINAGAIDADRIGAGNLNVGKGGIKMNGYLTVKGTVWGVGDDLPVGSIGYGEGSLPNGRKTYGIKLSLGENYFIITNAGARLELGGGSDNGGVTFGFYNNGL